MVSRRRVLVGAATLALLGSTALAACGSTPPVKDVDALLAQLARARSDGELAANAAMAAPPKLAAALTVVATQRTAHARALSDEITRISGDAPPTATSSSASSAPSASSSSAPSATTSGSPPAPPSGADVVAALEQSAAGASLAATQQSGYRAGLLGSIAAACTAAADVTLAGAGSTP